jgi:nicotinamide mononucleotide transporter
MQKIKGYFADWSKYEKIWLWSFMAIILATTVIFSGMDTDYSSAKSIWLNWVISPFGAISGIFSVVLAAKGKFSTWTWSIANIVFYGYLAYHAGYYGGALVEYLYFLPMQFIGMFTWKKMMAKDKTKDVRMKKLTWKQGACFGFLGIVATALFALFLNNVDNWFTETMRENGAIYSYFTQVFGEKFALMGPLIDASSKILQIFGLMLMIRALAEQWMLWMLSNIISIGMWTIVIIADPASMSWAIPTIIMLVAYLINSIYGYRVWVKGAKENERKNDKIFA